MPKDPLASWPTVVEAAKRMKISKRTLQLKLARHELTTAQRPTPGKKAATVVDPADIERYLNERIVKPAVLPNENSAIVKRSIVSTVAPPQASSVFADTVGGAAVSKRVALLSVARVSLWLRFDEAVAYSGLGESRLRELVDAGEVKTERGPHGSVVLRRADLERHAGAV